MQANRSEDGVVVERQMPENAWIQQFHTVHMELSYHKIQVIPLDTNATAQVSVIWHLCIWCSSSHIVEQVACGD